MNGLMKIGGVSVSLYMLLSAASFMVAQSRFPDGDAAAQLHYAQSTSSARTLKGFATAALIEGLIFIGIGWMQKSNGRK